MARSMASFELLGSGIDDARRKVEDKGIVGESSPEFVDCCSSRAVA
jgi:hypothetical protein